MNQSVNTDHPLNIFGYRKMPHSLWRLSPRLYVIVSALNDIRLIVTGKLTLHRAWQAGHDTGTQAEYRRIVVNGGDLVPYIKALHEARGALWELYNWKSRESFECDPAVKAIDEALAHRKTMAHILSGGEP